MRWTTAAAALILIPLNACIYYEGGDCESCDGNWDDWGQDDTGIDDGSWDDTDTDTDTEAPYLDLALFVTPNSAEQGDVLIASVQSSEDWDLSGATAAGFSQGVTVHAVQARPAEILVSLSVAEDATPEAVDLTVDFADGTTALAEDAMLLLEASADDGGTDTGDTDTDTDSDTSECP